MKLYFVRHATASNKAAWNDDDGLRPLTSTGRERFAVAARSLVDSGALCPELIITSPLVRAAQTAVILGETLAGSVPILEDARLGRDFDAGVLAAILSENGDAGSIAIVGHNPSFAAVLSAVVGDAVVDLRKGAVALVELEGLSPVSGRLLWLAPPTIFPGCP